MRHSTPSHFHRPDTIDDTLYVISVIFNPIRYRSRWKLYREFENYILSDQQAVLITVECTFGHRNRAITECITDRHIIIHVETKDELWLKENLVNIAIARLPENWKYVAWIDADVRFARPDWVGETLHKLQHHHLVQMFSIAQDLGPDFEPINSHKGFVYSYYHGLKCTQRYENWHPGFAWAATRDAINWLGGLIDWGILGSGDRHMATALIGKVRSSVNDKMSGRYLQLLDEWQERAEYYIKRNIGYVPGELIHYWHGKKRDRRYKDRWKVLIEHAFDPDIHIKRDSQGVWQFTHRAAELKRDCLLYLGQRQEDSIDTE